MRILRVGVPASAAASPPSGAPTLRAGPAGPTADYR